MAAEKDLSELRKELLKLHIEPAVVDEMLSSIPELLAARARVAELQAELAKLEKGGPVTAERFKIARCKAKACGAPIIWARTSNDKNIPVDAEGVRLVVFDGTRGGQPFARILTARKPHHSTCPAAAEFRKPKEPK